MNVQLGLSFVAGLLTTLSPCVLPILPFLIESAVRKNRKAPLYMVLGLAISFIVVGFVLSRFGTVLGLDSDQIRSVSAVLLMLTSVFFLFTKVQDFVSEKMTNFSSKASHASNNLQLDESSAVGSVLIGSLLGVIWSPCAGPTLGVAVSLASQDSQSLTALKIMIVYAIGAALPMLLISYGFRAVIQKNIQKIFGFAEKSKKLLGIVLLLSGAMIFFGVDKSVEAYLLNNLPSAWVDLITKY